MDRTGGRHPSGAEVNRARRPGRALSARDELRRRFRAAVVVAANEEEFFARLADAGVLVKPRESQTNPDETTGYAVALPGNTTADGDLVRMELDAEVVNCTRRRDESAWAVSAAYWPTGPVIA